MPIDKDSLIDAIAAAAEEVAYAIHGVTAAIDAAAGDDDEEPEKIL